MIRVKTTYRGKPSHEQPIAPGDYSDDDPALFGLADYLVEHGHAVRFLAQDSEPAPLNTEPVSNIEDTTQYPELDEFHRPTGRISRGKKPGR